MKYIFYLILATPVWLTANDLAEQKENPAIQVNLTVSNAHDENAQNTTTTSAKQQENQPQLPPQVIIIKDERSLAKTILHATAAACVPLAINALKNSQKVAELANRIISQWG